MKVEEEFDRLLEEQMRSAKGQRLEMLRKDKTGEKKLFCEVVRPVFPTIEGLILEHEIVSTSGVKIYIDMFQLPLRWGLESEGYVSHAQNITRDRFDFEQMRIRTMAMYGIKFIPFSWDELDKKPETCRRALYELLGRYSVTPGNAYQDLTVYEREVIRYALLLNRPFKMSDVCYCLQLGEIAGRKVLRSMITKKIIVATGHGSKRLHDFRLTEKAAQYLF